MRISEMIKDIIRIEKDTIDKLLVSVNKEYEKAINLILKCKGKVILTGIGKSGLIAKKIAATMASTGTPAIFMHPAEGMHGDLGIVQKNDIIIALSKSGESNELNGIINALKKIGTKIISITANTHSKLATSSDVTLYTKITKEACPFNLAPTNSTTAALVIGDALAIVLMKLRKFSQKDFALYHPGGKLGRSLLLTVGDLMRYGERNAIVNIHDTIKNMISILTNKMCGAVLVVDNKNKLKGLVTDYDIRKVVENKEDIFKKKISDIMNPKPTTVTPDIKAITALEIMEKRKKPISLLPVVNKSKKAVGIIHLHDIIASGLR